MAKDAKKLADRNANRSVTPHSKQFLKFIGGNWADRDNSLPKQSEVAPYAAKRRAAVAKAFKGKVVVIAAGDAKQRSNDTEYRFRAHSAFSHLTGWGTHTVPGSILVIDARKAAKAGGAVGGNGREFAVIFVLEALSLLGGLLQVAAAGGGFGARGHQFEGHAQARQGAAQFVGGIGQE